MTVILISDMRLMSMPDIFFLSLLLALLLPRVRGIVIYLWTYQVLLHHNVLMLYLETATYSSKQSSVSYGVVQGNELSFTNLTLPNCNTCSKRNVSVHFSVSLEKRRLPSLFHSLEFMLHIKTSFAIDSTQLTISWISPILDWKCETILESMR